MTTKRLTASDLCRTLSGILWQAKMDVLLGHTAPAVLDELAYAFTIDLVRLARREHGKRADWPAPARRPRAAREKRLLEAVPTGHYAAVRMNQRGEVTSVIHVATRKSEVEPYALASRLGEVIRMTELGVPALL